MTTSVYVLWSDLIARLDNVAIELQNQSESRLYVIFYRGRRDLPGLSKRHSGHAESYLVGSRGLEQKRVVAIDGGIRDCMAGELWLVPADAAPPTLTNTLNYSDADTDSAYKYDEYYYVLPDDLSETGSLSVGNELSLDGFAVALQARPNARGYILVYLQHWVDEGFIEDIDEKGRVRQKPYRNSQIDSAGTARKILANEKNYLVKEHNINPARIVTVNGGYRKGHNVELWIVPRGERPPVPTPNVYPPRRRKR